MPDELKPLSCGPAKLSGLSEMLIVSHWGDNHGGAVNRLNAIERKLADSNWAADHAHNQAGAYVGTFMNNLSWTAAEATLNKIGA